jgi:hypothetical protein
MIDGKKVVIGIFAIVLIVAVLTFSIYLLTRKDETVEDDGTSTPSAITELVMVEHLGLLA